MDTSIASTTFFVDDPVTGASRKHRIEIRRMKHHRVVKDKIGNETICHYGLWANGDWVEFLTEEQVKSSLKDVTWDIINQDMLDHLKLHP